MYMKRYTRFAALLLGVIMMFSMMNICFAAEGQSFTDVPADADYAEAAAWCAENNLMNGVGGGKFDPDGSMTRAMLATILYRQAR